MYFTIYPDLYQMLSKTIFPLVHVGLLSFKQLFEAYV